VSFVNSVSHELRTPLTNMLLNLDLVSEHTAAEGAPRLALVREEAGRLGRLIENVLTFSRGEQGRLVARARACQPGVVIETVLEQFQAAFVRRSIGVRRELAVGSCVVDADALAQIAANLLSNVEKYAPGSAVEIAVTLQEDSLCMRVADGGPGIPVPAAEKIFRPFERINGRITEGVTGTGLGLAIARELAETMGGTLQLVPSSRGAVFELRVPAPAIPEPRVNAA
jgi:signal transduction histidine kinase